MCSLDSIKLISFTKVVTLRVWQLRHILCFFLRTKVTKLVVKMLRN